jgi:hypothetical protein
MRPRITEMMGIVFTGYSMTRLREEITGPERQMFIVSLR